MLTLNQDFFVIVDGTGKVEYDYDGPIIEGVEGSDGKYIKDCLDYLSRMSQEPKRILKVKLVEIV